MPKLDCRFVEVGHAAEPAAPEYIREVCRGLKAAAAGMAGSSGSSVIYGGSAGPGLLSQQGDDVNGLFLGRFAPDPAAFASVLDEAAGLLAERALA